METELAWAAGFFDGEGCSYVQRARNHHCVPYVRLTISQKERSPLERFKRAVGVGRLYTDVNGLSYWMAGGRLQAVSVMEKLWPYLSEPKRRQYEEKLAEAGPPGKWGGRANNAKLTIEQVGKIRARYEAGGVTYRTLADQFGVARCTIGAVVRRENWAQI